MRISHDPQLNTLFGGDDQPDLSAGEKVAEWAAAKFDERWTANRVTLANAFAAGLTGSFTAQ